MFRQQFTHPEGNDNLTAVSASFVVPSVILEACICRDYPNAPTKCSYHEVLKIDPNERTKAMKAVIQSQELAFEAGKLLLFTRADKQDQDAERLWNLRGNLETSNEAVVMEKSIVHLIKCALLHHGTCRDIHIPCVVELDARLKFAGISDELERPMEGNETPLDRAKFLSWLHLLAAVPVLMANVSGKYPGAPGPRPLRWTAAVQVASIALALMENNSMRWEALFKLHGLSLWDYELVVRMHQSCAIFMMPAALPRDAVAVYTPILKANAERIYSVQPTNSWNLIICATLGIDKANQCQVLREATKAADANGDDSTSICLRWILCQAILLGAEGPSIPVADVLSIIKKVPDMSRQGFTHPEGTDTPGPASFVALGQNLVTCAFEECRDNHKPCTYHKMLKIDPDKRTKIMKAKIESMELAFEAGRLLLSTRAQTQDLEIERLYNLKGKVETSDDALVIEKSIVNLIKAALLDNGSCAGIHYPFIVELDCRLAYTGVSRGIQRRLAVGETPLERAKSLSWLHLLAALPILMAYATREDTDPWYLITGVQVADVALALMEHDSTRWEALLEPHGLPLWDYELVVRMQLSLVITEMATRLSEVFFNAYSSKLKANVERIYSVQPTNHLNLTYCAALRCAGTVPFGAEWCQVLREALKIADVSGDDNSSVYLRWHLCQSILLGGEGPTFELADVLSIIAKARAAMEEIKGWTPRDLVPPKIYGPCLGVAARYKVAIKQDPSFAQRRMQAYASPAPLHRETQYVTCATCHVICYPLKKCSGCKSVGYCSKKCQIKDWKAGHKHACTQQTQPDSQRDA